MNQTKALVGAILGISILLLLFYILTGKQYKQQQVHVDNTKATKEKPTIVSPQIKPQVDTKKVGTRSLSILIPKEGEKFVVSYGLYGNDPKYTTGAIRNAELIRHIYPGWICRFYHDNTVPATVLTQLEELGAELINVANDGMSGGIGGMFWRFLVAGDNTVDRYIVRDSDSRLNAREAAAVEEWIESGYLVHSMRDHLGHDAPMNGGMWGGVKGAIPDIIQKIKAWPNRDQFWMDMNFLAKEVWPLVKEKALSHDSVVCEKYPNSKPFPTRRIAKEHVGQVFDALESPRLGDMNDGRMDTPSPMACRKKPHWTHG